MKGLRPMFKFFLFFARGCADFPAPLVEGTIFAPTIVKDELTVFMGSLSWLSILFH